MALSKMFSSYLNQYTLFATVSFPLLHFFYTTVSPLLDLYEETLQSYNFTGEQRITNIFF